MFMHPTLLLPAPFIHRQEYNFNFSHDHRTLTMDQSVNSLKIPIHRLQPASNIFYYFVHVRCAEHSVSCPRPERQTLLIFHAISFALNALAPCSTQPEFRIHLSLHFTSHTRRTISFLTSSLRWVTTAVSLTFSRNGSERERERGKVT